MKGGGNTLESQVLKKLLQTGAKLQDNHVGASGVNLNKTLVRDKNLHTSVPPHTLRLLGDEKVVSEIKCDLILLYLNIRSLVPKFLAKEVFSPSQFN